MENGEITLKGILAHIKQDKKWEDKHYWLHYEPDLIAVLKWYYYEKLEWCGCGCPGEAMREVAKYLEARSLDYPESDAKMKEYFQDGDDNNLVLCLAYELDRAGFTEHGSSVYSCWLTDDGKYFLWAIQEADKQDELDF